MKIFRNPKKAKWAEILSRPVKNSSDLESVVGEVFEDVNKEGDNALKKYTQKFDNVLLESIEISCFT